MHHETVTDNRLVFFRHFGAKGTVRVLQDYGLGSKYYELLLPLPERERGTWSKWVVFGAVAALCWYMYRLKRGTQRKSE